MELQISLKENNHPSCVQAALFHYLNFLVHHFLHSLISLHNMVGVRCQAYLHSKSQKACLFFGEEELGSLEVNYVSSLRQKNKQCVFFFVLWPCPFLLNFLPYNVCVPTQVASTSMAISFAFWPFVISFFLQFFSIFLSPFSFTYFYYTKVIQIL